ncbi:hypothetical protein COO91_02500 [Nostoc flagelliforme CCNUN1]|uniref:Uncharacterized protein n=1 Tax=Nostoc flagelliforme CCNUN1 TaxID=2038116 RepID=A0A2K8SMC0_9NOSO|nr:hypothetical protein COO91_02500 [Nostoc flagelliforme CCNUN1]
MRSLKVRYCRLTFQVMFDILKSPESRFSFSNHRLRLLVSSQPVYT